MISRLDRQTFTVPVTIVITSSRCNGDSTSRCHGDKSFCFHLIVLLPQANKIWSKVIFSHLCVILFIGVCLQWRGLHPEGSASRVVGQTVSLLDTTGCGQRAGSTDPIGMHLVEH